MTPEPHPEELLAAYVDGELDDVERRTVETHLTGCARCREEVALARASVARLRSLPELEAPDGAASRALAEAGGADRPAAAARPPRWARWVPAAAAAALVVLVAVVALRPNGESSSTAAGARNLFTPGAETGVAPNPSALSTANPAEAQHALDAALAKPVHLEQQDLNYTTDDIRALTDDSATSYRGARVPGTRGAAASFSGVESTSALASDAKTALDCVESQVAPTSADALVRLIEARYEGAPAYVAVVVEAPGPGKPANEVLVWVVRKDGCTIANFAFRAL